MVIDVIHITVLNSQREFFLGFFGEIATCEVVKVVERNQQGNRIGVLTAGRLRSWTKIGRLVDGDALDVHST